MRRLTDRDRMVIGFRTGAKSGFVSGLGIAIAGWLAASLLKGLITDFTGVWPEWFAGGQIVDFFLTGWWVVITILSCTVTGAVVGVLTRKRYELL